MSTKTLLPIPLLLLSTAFAAGCENRDPNAIQVTQGNGIQITANHARQGDDSVAQSLHAYVWDFKPVATPAVDELAHKEVPLLLVEVRKGGLRSQTLLHEPLLAQDLLITIAPTDDTIPRSEKIIVATAQAKLNATQRKYIDNPFGLLPDTFVVQQIPQRLPDGAWELMHGRKTGDAVDTQIVCRIALLRSGDQIILPAGTPMDESEVKELLAKDTPDKRQ